MKYALIIVASLMLVGCSDSIKEMDFRLPQELADCSIHRLSNGWNSIYVTRCPNSQTTTTYQDGKVQSSSVVIDGVEYLPVTR